MATLFSQETAPEGLSPPQKIGNAGYNARVKWFRATITLATQTTADKIKICKRPTNHRFAVGMMTTDTSLATAQIAVGNTTVVDKYKAAGVLTALDTPTLFGKVSAMDDAPDNVEEEIFISISVASLPASGVLVVDMAFIGP